MSQSLSHLLGLAIEDLQALSDEAGIPARAFPWRDGLITDLLDADGRDAYGCGVLEVHGEGFGFLRSPYTDLLPGPDDIYVSQSQIKRFELRTGDTVIGRIRPPKEQERYAALLRVEAINGDPPDRRPPAFETLPAVHPATRLPLARDPWLAAIDWVAPLGLGARGLLLGSGRSPREELLRRLAAAFGADEAVEVHALLLGARPEDVTEWRETVDAEVYATPLDEAPAKHLQVADIAFERARRMAESGGEVLLLVDSLTRLLRFALADTAASGHVVDGLESAAVQRLRRWFATGRDLRGAGSVTLVATCDQDTGDPLSDALVRDLAGAATWQLSLHDTTPGAAARPDVDLRRTWTRHEERLVAEEELERRLAWRARVIEGEESTAEALAQLFRPSPVDAPANG